MKKECLEKSFGEKEDKALGRKFKRSIDREARRASDEEGIVKFVFVVAGIAVAIYFVSLVGNLIGYEPPLE